MGQVHPSAQDMAAYVDGAVSQSDRERIERHAAECEECRAEIAEVTEMMKQVRRAPAWRVWAPAAAAAAVVALLLLRPLWVGMEPDGASRFRGPESTASGEGTVAIRVSAPADAGVTDPAGITFVWYAGGVGASYQLTLTNDEGGVLWTLATTDTVASLPDSIELERASVYYWYVDALLADGQTSSSGVRSFTTLR